MKAEIEAKKLKVPPNTEKIIFININLIFDFHKILYDTLEREKQKGMIGTVFKKMVCVL
jgi:hypothetical protein